MFKGNVYSIKVENELKPGNTMAVFIGNYRRRQYRPNMPIVGLKNTENQQILIKKSHILLY